MRVQGSGSATFLMLLVLGVMAVVGVFGLPQFEPVVASPNAVDDHQWSDNISSYEQAGAGEAVAQGVEDLFAPTNASAETTPVGNDNHFAALDLDRLEEQGTDEPQIVDLIADPAPPQRLEQEMVAAESPFAPESTQDQFAEVDPAFREFAAEQQTADNEPTIRQASAHTEFDSRFGRQPSPATSSRPRLERKTPSNNRPQDRLSAVTQPLTWRAAVARLNSLGIRKYRLMPGSTADEFHFSCFFSPTNNPRLTHRFEAEASEPLQAVEKVLAQVDEWRGNR